MLLIHKQNFFVVLLVMNFSVSSSFGMEKNAPTWKHILFPILGLATVGGSIGAACYYANWASITASLGLVAAGSGYCSYELGKVAGALSAAKEREIIAQDTNTLMDKYIKASGDAFKSQHTKNLKNYPWRSQVFKDTLNKVCKTEE